MDESLRLKRLTQAVTKANVLRKKQKQKIDILCKDFINSQVDFIEQLNSISFAAEFYKSIIGHRDTNKLLYTAARLLCRQADNLKIVFVLNTPDSFEIHAAASNAYSDDADSFEQYFNTQLVQNICSSNSICTLDVLYELGLECSPMLSKKIDAVTLPLGTPGASLGFILAYSYEKNRLTPALLDKITLITTGLSKAIQTCTQTAGLYHS